MYSFTCVLLSVFKTAVTYIISFNPSSNPVRQILLILIYEIFAFVLFEMGSSHMEANLDSDSLCNLSWPGYLHLSASHFQMLELK